MSKSYKIIGMLILIMFPFSTYAFSDLTENSQYYDAIVELRDSGVVSGYPDGTFQSDRTIARVEFLKIIVESYFTDYEYNKEQQYNIDNCGGGATSLLFTDVDYQSWYAQYVCIAKELNIVEGYPDGTFKPANQISIAEAAKILVNAYGVPGNSLELSLYDSGRHAENIEERAIEILLSNNVVPWYSVPLALLESHDVLPQDILRAIHGGNYSYEITRGEMAQMISSILNILSKSQEPSMNQLFERLDNDLAYAKRYNDLKLLSQTLLTYFMEKHDNWYVDLEIEMYFADRLSDEPRYICKSDADSCNGLVDLSDVLDISVPVDPMVDNNVRHTGYTVQFVQIDNGNPRRVLIKAPLSLGDSIEWYLGQ